MSILSRLGSLFNPKSVTPPVAVSDEEKKVLTGLTTDHDRAVVRKLAETEQVVRELPTTPKLPGDANSFHMIDSVPRHERRVRAAEMRKKSKSSKRKKTRRIKS